MQEKMSDLDQATRERMAHLLAALGTRSIVLVGMMGAGKSSIGRRLADRLGLRFTDTDNAIERAAAMSIPEIFKTYGEAYFRDGERKVIARLLREGPQVMATGGGAFINSETHAAIARDGVSLWLKADFDVLMRRVRKRANRPLLLSDDPEVVMRRLMEARYPIYATANVTVATREGPHEAVLHEVLMALDAYLCPHLPPLPSQSVPEVHDDHTHDEPDEIMDDDNQNNRDDPAGMAEPLAGAGKP